MRTPKFRFAVLTAAILAALSGCGGGGGGGGSSSGGGGSSEQPLGGFAFDGPIANAAVAVYRIDKNANNGSKIGNPIDTGVTSSTGEITGIDIRKLTEPPYLVEVTAGPESTDFDTGKAPVLPVLKTLITDIGQKEVQASVLTTLAVESAKKDGTDARPFEWKVRKAARTVVAKLVPVALPQGFDSEEIFTVPPVPDKSGMNETEVKKVQAYWTAAQATLSMMHNLAKDNPELSTEQAVAHIANDISDGELDGRGAGNAEIPIPMEEIEEKVKEVDPATLTIPNSGDGDKPPKPITSFKEQVQKLLDEKQFEQPPEITDETQPVVGKPKNLDSDGDGVKNTEDAFPMDPKETKDSDKDGVGDNGDAFPNDPTETKDSDGDKVGDNKDAFPNDPKESVDTDGDQIGNNTDPDDDNDGLTDEEEEARGTNPLLKDTDGDKVNDKDDAFPNDASETLDTDGDKIGNNADPDDDNDGLTDDQEKAKGTDPLLQDTDSDGRKDNNDNCPNKANPDQKDSDNDGIGDVCQITPQKAVWNQFNWNKANWQ